MDDDEVTPLTTATTNYGFVKPDVGASDDVWGGLLNADLDSIDSTVKGVSNVANAAYPAANPSGYQTAAQVTAAVPVASSTTPAMNGTAAVGSGTTWARADHVHPTDTSGWLGDNRIINGDMRIDQRNNGASGTAVGYTVDRWVFTASLATKGTWGRGTLGAGSTPFPYALTFTSNSAYTPLTGDYFQFASSIEGDAISDFQWGTANAQPVTLSFWVNASFTGTFGGCLSNYASTRSYPFTFSIPSTANWTQVKITIPGDTSVAWVLSGNAGALSLHFDLGTGATYRGPANAWASANYVGANGTANIVGTNGASFFLTGVKLEIGSVATPFNRQSLAKCLADCKRYYQVLGGGTASVGIQGYSPAAVPWAHTIGFQSMRAAPTVTQVGNWTNTNVTLATFFASTQQMLFQVSVLANQTFSLYPTDATGALTLSAEL